MESAAKARISRHPTVKPSQQSARKPTWLALGFLGLVKFYRLFISPLLGPRCRYQPTCSSYALEAIEHHGALKGGWLAARRIGRCHPWGGFGYDPVPKSVGAKTDGYESRDEDFREDHNKDHCESCTANHDSANRHNNDKQV